VLVARVLVEPLVGRLDVDVAQLVEQVRVGKQPAVPRVLLVVVLEGGLELGGRERGGGGLAVWCER
jgi:hypothetical protein